MADVTYIGTNFNNVSGAKSISATIPAHQVGDLIVVQLEIQSTGTKTVPTEWAQLLSRTNVSSKYIFYKIAGSSSESFVASNSTNANMHVSASVYRNTDLAAPIQGYVSQTSAATTINVSVPSSAYNFSNGNGLHLIMLFLGGTSVANMPSGYTERYRNTTSLSTIAQLFSNSVVGNGSTGAKTLTTSVAQSYDSVSFVIVPPQNNPPILTLTSPTDNQTLAEGNKLPVEGSATDLDVNDPVTFYVQINNGTPVAVHSGVSDGSTAISFAKQLEYRNKRIYYGTTDLAGADLAENTDHALKVWAEDNKQGKSAVVTRQFRVIWNRPPTISDNNRDLGIIKDAPSINYTVTDPETNAFTVTEKINGSIIRSFAGVAGRQETVTIPLDTWLRLEPGVLHTLTIEATDNQGMTSIRAYTLTRFVDKIVFNGMDFSKLDEEIKTKFTTDVAAQRLLLTPVWDLPPGVILLVEVCNNAYDEEPTWEDATVEVKLNRAHLFSNTTKTAEQWGVNFRFVIEKGTAIAPVYFRGVGGAFD